MCFTLLIFLRNVLFNYCSYFCFSCFFLKHTYNYEIRYSLIASQFSLFDHNFFHSERVPEVYPLYLYFYHLNFAVET